MPSVILCISWAIEYLWCKVDGLFVNLSDQSMMFLNRIVLAIDSLLAIEEHNKIRQDCSCTRLQICVPTKLSNPSLTAMADLKFLSILSKSNSKVCERYVATAL